MSIASEIGLYREALVFLGTAGVIIPLMTRFRISPVVGFLVAGLLLGPHAIGRFADTFPPLGWITIRSQEAVDQLAELGVAFLLFTIGLELSLDRLWTMRRSVFGLGMAQVALTTAAIAVTAFAFGNPIDASLVIGACLALSSTAIVVQLLAEQHRLTSVAGRNIFGVLLAQDLAVVPILFLIVVFGEAGKGGSEAITLQTVLSGLGIAVIQAVAAISLIVGIGRVILRRLFRSVARTHNRELFMAAILFVVVGTSLITLAAGLSMALGAFLAGLLLAETEFRRQVEVDIEPFKGLLLGLFFISVGMRIDPASVAQHPVMLAMSVIGMTGLKAAVIALLARLFGLAWPVALEASLLLAGGGEFAFFVLSLAGSSGLTTPEVEQFMLLVASGTMLATPVLARMGRSLGQRSTRATALTDLPAETPEAIASRPLVIGGGRVGKLVCDVLAGEGYSCLVIDRDAELVARGRAEGRDIIFGDAQRPGILRKCGIETAPIVVVTLHDAAITEQVVTMLHRLRPDLPVIARARDADHAVRLFSMGAVQVIPEAFETGLDLAGVTLRRLGAPAEHTHALLETRREAMLRLLRSEPGPG